MSSIFPSIFGIFLLMKLHISVEIITGEAESNQILSCRWSWLKNCFAESGISRKPTGSSFICPSVDYCPVTRTIMVTLIDRRD